MKTYITMLAFLVMSQCTFGQALNENFNSGLPGSWGQFSNDGITWAANSSLGPNNSGCAIVDESSGQTNGTAWFQSPFMNLSQLTNPEINFDVALIRNNFIPPDISLWYSTGGNWQRLRVWGGTSADETITQTSNRPPLSSTSSISWVNVTFNLSQFATNTNIRFSFGSDFTNGGWVLLDNVIVRSRSSQELVTSITVNGKNQNSSITRAGGSLQMETYILPSNATNNSVTWSVITGTGSATINNTGIVKAVSDGTVTVRATANDGSGVFGERQITISNQSLAVGYVVMEKNTIYPNPSSGVVHIQTTNLGSDGVEIYLSNALGERFELINVTKKTANDATVDLSEFPKGVYFLTIMDEEKLYVFRTLLVD